MRKIVVTFVPGLLGAMVGAYLGSLVVAWTRMQGFYTVVLPGAVAGLVCGFLSVNHSKVRGVLCSVIALAAGVLTEWKYFAPPVEVDGLADFVAHFYREPWVTLIMVGLGTLLGFWWGRETTCPWRHRFASQSDRPLIEE